MDTQAIVKAMEEAGVTPYFVHDQGEPVKVGAFGTKSAWARFRGVPLDEVEALRILADGCSLHATYRAKRKVVTTCQRCNEMWEARQKLARLRGGES
jgi:hypothetical protein